MGNSSRVTDQDEHQTWDEEVAKYPGVLQFTGAVSVVGGSRSHTVRPSFPELNVSIFAQWHP